MSPRALLFSEMVTSSAVIHGPADRLLRIHGTEHPVALQLGGSDPGELAAAAARGARAGFDEINLNVGCPSPRVRQGRFGASLMREGALVRDCVAAMSRMVDVPVTVKCRLGVDDHDSQPLLEAFVGTVAESGCRTFYLHARKALLKGLSPAENRTVPPLEYERVYAVKRRFPELEIVVNGGITHTAELPRHLATVDGVMIGRAAYQRPMVLGEMEDWVYRRSRSGDRSHSQLDRSHSQLDRSHSQLDRSHSQLDRSDSRGGRSHSELDRSHSSASAWWVMEGYRAYMAEEVEHGTRLAAMTRHALGLFSGVPGARRFRRILSDARRLNENDLSLVDEALAALSADAPDFQAA